MEVYAGFLEHTDHHVGRLIDALEDLEILDDTLVYVIIGDNGASAEGTPHGTFNELLVLNGANHLETTEFMAARIDLFGTPEAYNHYAVGWAHAMDTPVPVDEAGRIALGRHPQRDDRPLAERVSRRRARSATSSTTSSTSRRPCSRPPACPAPLFVHGIQQAPLEGVSMAYTFDDAGAEDRHTTQYFEMFVNRGIYHRGLDGRYPPLGPVGPDGPASSRSTTTSGSCMAPMTGPSRGTWRSREPEQLAHLQRLFLIEAGKYNVLPLDDRRVERFNADIAGRPQLIQGNPQILFGGMGRLSENSLVVLKNKSHAVTAEVVVPEGGASGTIVAQGGAFGGWSLYMTDGKPAYCYNLFGLQQFKVYGSDPVPAGDHQIRVEFTYDGGGLGKGGDVPRSSSTAARSERAASTRPSRWPSRRTRRRTSATTPATPVTDDLEEGKAQFGGGSAGSSSTLATTPQDADHLISPEERYRIAMARQ